MPPTPVSPSGRRRARGPALLAAGALLAALAGCGLGRNGGSDDGGAVPVVTSVVGGSGGPGASGGTRPAGGGNGATGSGPPGTGFSAAARGYGEPEQPMAVPSTAAPQISEEAAPAVADAARGFLAVYWAGGARTWGQLADALAPYATDTLLAGYRDPARADRPAPAATVGDQSVEVTEARDATAVATGRGTSVEGDRKVSVWRTLQLTRDDAGTWKVASFR